MFILDVKPVHPLIQLYVVLILRHLQKWLLHPFYNGPFQFLSVRPYFVHVTITFMFSIFPSNPIKDLKVLISFPVASEFLFNFFLHIFFIPWFCLRAFFFRNYFIKTQPQQASKAWPEFCTAHACWGVSFCILLYWFVCTQVP